MIKSSRVRKNFKSTASALLAMTMLAGCSHTVIGQADRAVNTADDNSMTGFFKSQLPMAPDRTPYAEESDGIWSGGHAVRSDHGDPLPYQWESMGVTLQDPSRPLTLREIAQKITQGTNIPVTFAPDINPAAIGQAKGKDSGSGGSSDGKGKRGANGADVNDALTGMGLSGSANGSETEESYGEKFGNEQSMVLSFRSGPLSELLNEVCSYYGLSWRYSDDNGGRIVIYRNVIRTYYINALPLKTMEMNGGMTQSLNSSASAGSGQATKSAGGDGNQKTTTAISIRIWEDITAGIKSIMTATGEGDMTASPSTSTISVVAPAQTMDRVQSFIERQNSILSKQVVISVEVLSVQMQSSDALTIQVNGLVNKANKLALAYGTGGTSELAAVADAGQAVLGTVNSSGSSNGTQFLIQELSKIGNVEVTTDTNVMTLNGLPVPVQVAQTRGYVAEVQTMNTGVGDVSSSNSQTTMSPGSVTFGFNMMLLPQVLPDNKRVRLHISSSLSDLHGDKDGFNEFTSGNQTIQLPNIISRNFQQEATVPSGQTVYLSGFQQTQTIVNKNGTGTPNVIALGGNQNGSKTRTMLIIAVSPVVLSNNIIDYTDGQ